MTDERHNPPAVGTEYEMLDAFLAYYQQTILVKIAGLSDEQLHQVVVPSGITLLGMVKHLAWVHRWWFRMCFAGEDIPDIWTKEDPDSDWRVEPNETRESLIAFYQDEVARGRQIANTASLDDRSVRPTFQPSMRWIMVHMIEELARHAGHADIMRELIDGKTGE